jgi:hypothetical protein
MRSMVTYFIAKLSNKMGAQHACLIVTHQSCSQYASQTAFFTTHTRPPVHPLAAADIRVLLLLPLLLLPLLLLLQAMSLKYLTSHSRKCPGCGMATIKNEGCNKMTCGYCRAAWCWKCQQVSFAIAVCRAWGRSRGFGRHWLQDSLVLITCQRMPE